MDGIAATPGTCMLHGYHGMQLCPTCSSAPRIPLNVSTPAQPDLSWLYKAGYEAGWAAAMRERDLTPKDAAVT